MIRVIIENILLFLLPAAMYVGYVPPTRRGNTRRRRRQLRRWCGCSWPEQAVAATLIYYAIATPAASRSDLHAPRGGGRAHGSPAS
jgi:hypothetical protein